MVQLAPSGGLPNSSRGQLGGLRVPSEGIGRKIACRAEGARPFGLLDGGINVNQANALVEAAIVLSTVMMNHRH